MKFQVKEILDATNGELLHSKNTSGNFSISTDSRTINPEEIFMPITGENFDGHNFIKTALEKGCRGFITDKAHVNQIKDHFTDAKFVIAVENTLEAYLKIANQARKKINPIVIGITGSSGKTTTKEILYSVLSKQFKTCKSKLNHNNEIGLCQTLLSMPIDTEIVVAEMGMRGLGEIEILSKYAEPDIGIITNAGNAHIGRLGSVENIAIAKSEITKHLNPEGWLIAHKNGLIDKNTKETKNRIFYDMSDVNINEHSQDFIRFEYKNNEYCLNVGGEYNIINSLAVIEAATLCGLSPHKIKEGLNNYMPIDNRGEVITLNKSIKIVNDSYNANPESVKAAVKSLTETHKNIFKTLVIGDMAELGEFSEKLHRETGKFINNLDINRVITIGDSAKLIAQELNQNKIATHSFDSIEDGTEFIKQTLEKNSVVLLKASRCMAFDKIADELRRMDIQ